jgi:hypothetical protein
MSYVTFTIKDINTEIEYIVKYRVKTKIRKVIGDHLNKYVTGSCGIYLARKLPDQTLEKLGFGTTLEEHGIIDSDTIYCVIGPIDHTPIRI